MSKIKNIFYNIISTSYIYAIGMMAFAKADLLDRITRDAETAGAPNIYLGSDKTTVGRAVFGDLSGRGVLTNFTSTFLKITVAISVTMLIYAGIKYILATGDAKEEGVVRQKIINTIVGVILAMSAVLIIYLAGSISQDVINITSQT